MKYFLGVDGGGTKTEAVLIDENKKIVSRQTAKGSNANVLGFATALANLNTAVSQALRNRKQIMGVFAIAGIDTPKNIKVWSYAFKEHPTLPKFFKKPPLFINDIKASLRSGTDDKNAISIIAGTGSSCWGYNEFGEEAKSGGQDYILSDEGSGYYIGSRILHIVTRAIDGRGPWTILVDLLFEKFQIKSLEEFHSLVYEKPWDKIDIAQIAPLVEKASKKGDSEAVKITDDAAGELALMGKAVVTKLKMKDKSYTIVLSGSVFNIQNISDRLHEKLFKFSPMAKFVKPSMSSAQAAAILALENES